MPTAARRWLPAILLILLAGGVVAWLQWPTAARRARAEAARLIEDFLENTYEDADIIELEDALRPLGPPGVDAVVAGVKRTGSVRLLRACEGLDPRLALPAMERLTVHQNPEVRHGALLALGRFDQISTERWEVILANPAEDRFVRQLAAHELGRTGRWWEGLKPGSDPQPVPPEGSDRLAATGRAVEVGSLLQRRTTMTRASVSLGDLCDELAWVLGPPADYPAAAAAEPMTNVFYRHVQLAGLMQDLRLRTEYGVHHFSLSPAGALRVERVYAERDE